MGESLSYFVERSGGRRPLFLTVMGVVGILICGVVLMALACGVGAEAINDIHRDIFLAGTGADMFGPVIVACVVLNVAVLGVMLMLIACVGILMMNGRARRLGMIMACVWILICVAGVFWVPRLDAFRAAPVMRVVFWSVVGIGVQAVFPVGLFMSLRRKGVSEAFSGDGGDGLVVGRSAQIVAAVLMVGWGFGAVAAGLCTWGSHHRIVVAMYDNPNFIRDWVALSPLSLHSGDKAFVASLGVIGVLYFVGVVACLGVMRGRRWAVWVVMVVLVIRTSMVITSWNTGPQQDYSRDLWQRRGAGALLTAERFATVLWDRAGQLMLPAIVLGVLSRRRGW